MKCNDCKQEKPDVRWRTCPYAEEIYCKEVWLWLCDECSYERYLDT